eukprot:symbB.v1.2.032015.t1/scaffold3786.1/size52255/2
MQRELRFARFEGCLREIGFSRYLQRCGHTPAELLALRHLATHAVSQTTLAAKDTVFEAGTVAHEAHFLAHGSFEYVLSMSERVGHQRWVSEMTLWTPWLHLGDLTTTEDSAVVSLKAHGFFDCMRRWWNLFEMAQAYAREYVKAVSSYAAVTDLWHCPSHVGSAEDEHRPSLRSSGSFQVLGRLGGGASKKEDKKKAKEAEKKAKEEERKRKEEEALAAKNAKFAGPSLDFHNFQEQSFGNVFIQSQGHTDRQWTNVGALKPEMKDSMVWIRARVHNTRKQGNKLCFLTLRQDVATVQAVTFGQDIAGFSGTLPDESVVDVLGKVACPEAPIVSCTVQNVELSVEKIFCIGRSQALPLRLADASRSEAELEKDPSLPTVGQDVRLDNRIIDLRTVANQAIFRLQSGVCMLFREFLLQNDFQEIHTPKLIGGASEGGADVFRVDYFEGNAYLAQSPQLYKQMALMTDMPRVFEVGPIFRSEKSFTHRHMTEFTGLDIEMTFKDHYHEVLAVLDGLFNHIFKGLTERFAREIEAVKTQYPFEDLKWKHPCLRLKHSRRQIGLRLCFDTAPMLTALPVDQFLELPLRCTWRPQQSSGSSSPSEPTRRSIDSEMPISWISDHTEIRRLTRTTIESFESPKSLNGLRTFPGTAMVIEGSPSWSSSETEEPDLEGKSSASAPVGVTCKHPPRRPVKALTKAWPWPEGVKTPQPPRRPVIHVGVRQALRWAQKADGTWPLKKK